MSNRLKLPNVLAALQPFSQNTDHRAPCAGARSAPRTPAPANPVYSQLQCAWTPRDDGRAELRLPQSACKARYRASADS